MKTKASMVVFSHLSDAQEQIIMGCATNGIIYNINFIKYIINETGGDLNKEIDVDAMWKKYNRWVKKIDNELLF